VTTGLVVANCGSSSKMSKQGGIDPKYGVAASPKVVADGDPVPKGGGRQMVGKPYVVAGRLYTPREMNSYSATGTASWYGPSFHGRMTANGEVFDRMSISAAHPTMPLPSYIRVTNVGNGHSIIARVNDRGPYHGGRLIDVSQRVAEALAFKNAGTARVRVDYVGRASTAGSDDSRLYATLRTDGYPAQLNGMPTMVASAQQDDEAPAPVARAAASRPEPVQQAATVVEKTPSAPAPVPVVAVGRPAPGVPLPPDRPFDLGAAAAAAGKASPATRARTAANGGNLVFAAADPQASAGFRKQDPMAALIQQSFVPATPRQRIASN
jgi:rare lipoprotein A